ncbi:unnamed protein product [Schistosoma mattheei]|uniref:Uncharacterized protein n=1 Tax=Schistosoma mattheei TaxID=31246 RepID=A0A183NSG8_9TREM|nr:unnamed protein product [Schistosoma mattheei]
METGQTALQSFNIAFLQHTGKLSEFKITLNNRFQTLQDLLKEEQQTITKYNWKGTREALTSTCQEVLCRKKHHHKEWMSIETVDKIQEMKNKKTALNSSRTRAWKHKSQAEYTKASKQVKKSIRANKRKFVKQLVVTVKEAAREGNMRGLCDRAKKLAGKYSKPERSVKENEDNLITEIQEQRDRRVEYFEELLNRSAPLSLPGIEAAPTDLPIDVTPPTFEEIRMVIRQIDSGKAAGPDSIPAETQKSDIQVTANMHHILFREIWEEEQVSTDWKEGHLIKIPKKGDLSKCEDYRGITLLSVPGKVFDRVLLNRIKDLVHA